MTTVLKSEASPYPASQFYPIAVYALRGPEGLSWRTEGRTAEHDKNWGSVVFQLRKRLYQTDFNETFTVYANLFDPLQDSAVIRSLKWDGKSARNLMRTSSDTFQLTMQAKFVEIPLAVVKIWIDKFVNFPITLQRPERDDNVPIRALRIELDYVMDTLEVEWANEIAETRELNIRWEQVWQAIKGIVDASSSVETVWEDFSYGDVNVTYTEDTIN